MSRFQKMYSKEEFKVIYTMSHIEDMPKNILNSLKSINRFIDRKRIIIIYTPPIKKSFIKELEKYAVVKISENITEKFHFMNERGFIRAGEKIQLCNIDCDNIIFLDCDTIIKKDISLLLNDEYDFMGRIEERAQVKFDTAKYNNMFKINELNPIPMFNCGFMIFKNRTHNKIKNNWIKYFNSDIERFHPFSFQKEQYALALALSVHDIKYMSNKEHAYRWYDEEHVNTYVLHGTKKDVNKKILLIKRTIRSLIH